MKRTRLINIVALLINLGIVACFFAGVYFKFIEPCIKDFSKFNNLGWEIVYEFRKFPFFVASFNMIASLFMMFCNGVSAKSMRDRTPRFFFTLRYMAMGISMLSIVFIGVAFYRATGADKMNLLISMKEGNLFFNTCIPLASIGLFVFFELEQKCRFRKNFGPLILFACYVLLGFGLMLYYQFKGNMELAHQVVEYNCIFWVTEDLIKTFATSGTLNVISTRSLLVVTIILSFVLPTLLWCINRILSSLIIGYEYVQIDDNDNVIKPISRPEYKKEEKSEKKNIKKTNKSPRPDVYHVAVFDHKARNWKVVMPNKEMKVFPTQEEALGYASFLANNAKGIVRVHTALGKLKFNPNN